MSSLLTLLVAIGLRWLAVVGIVLAVGDIIGTSLYEVRATNRHRRQLLHPHARRYRLRPLVSVVVLTRDNEASIADCLESVLKSSYRNLEIVVADNMSHDGTRRAVWGLAADNPRRPIKLFAKRRTGLSEQVVREAYKAHGRGDIILTLPATVLLDRQAIRRAVDRLNADPQLGRLGLRPLVQVGYSGYGLAQKYQELIAQRLRKMASSFGAYLPDDLLCVQRREVLEASARRQPGQLIARRPDYAADVVVYATAQPSLGRAISGHLNLQRRHVRNLWGRGFRKPVSRQPAVLIECLWLVFAFGVELAALLVPLMLTYFAYLALRLHEPTLLGVGAVLLSLLLGFAIWSDEQLRRRQKLGYTLGIPLTYGLFYVLSFGRYLALLWLLVRPRPALPGSSTLTHGARSN